MCLVGASAFLLGATAGTTVVQVAYALAGGLLFIVGSLIVSWPAFLRAKQQALYDFPVAIMEAHKAVADVAAVQREHKRFLFEIEDVNKRLEQRTADLEGMKTDLQGMQEVLRRLHTDVSVVVDLRQQIGQLGREMDDWRETAISFFDLLERQLDNDALSEERRAILEETVQQFAAIVARRGLSLIRPQAGELFVPTEHEARGEVHDDDVAARLVLECRAWGFRDGAQVIRKAGVVLSAGPVVEPEKEPGYDDAATSEGAATEKPSAGEAEMATDGAADEPDAGDIETATDDTAKELGAASSETVAQGPAEQPTEQPTEQPAEQPTGASEEEQDRARPESASNEVTFEQSGRNTAQ